MRHRVLGLALAGAIMQFPFTVPALAAEGPDVRPTKVAEAESMSVDDVLGLARRLISTGHYEEAQILLDGLAGNHAGGAERDFLDGMIGLASQDYLKAERLFRKILDARPNLTRVRLELARTLFLMKRDEQADYQFRLASAEHPPAEVSRNIARFREAMRDRRAWRFNFNVGIAPDTNINAATSKQAVEIFGLPFQLDESARAQSGLGLIAGAEANARLFRDQPVAIYLAGYGQITGYPDRRFDDIYLGGETGPEFHLSGGRLRAAGTVLQRWYGGAPLVTQIGARLHYDKVIGGNSGMEAMASMRRENYPGRSDLNAWNFEATLSGNQGIGASAMGFGYVAVQRNRARDRAYSYWSGRFGGGVLKEMALALRLQLAAEISHQEGDAPMLLFNRTRRDWGLSASASIYKRDWNFAGFAPALRLSYSRTLSTVTIYDQSRWRGEFSLTKAF